MENKEEIQRKKKVAYNVNRTRELRQNKIIKQFKCTLPYEEVEEINKLLAKKNMNKVEFVRYGYKKLKEED